MPLAPPCLAAAAHDDLRRRPEPSHAQQYARHLWPCQGALARVPRLLMVIFSVLSEIPRGTLGAPLMLKPPVGPAVDFS